MAVGLERVVHGHMHRHGRRISSAPAESGMTHLVYFVIVCERGKCAGLEDSNLQTGLVHIDRFDLGAEVIWSEADNDCRIPNANLVSLIESPPVSAFLFISCGLGQCPEGHVAQNFTAGLYHLGFCDGAGGFGGRNFGTCDHL